MKKHSVRELASLFLRLGGTAFGGPAAHIAMMEDEVVRRRRWLTHEEFLDLMGATNLIPGPNSTEMAIHIGHRRAGFPGLAVAGICFIVPAMLIVLAFAWGYVRFGKLPQVQGLLYGVKPVMIAIVIQALWRLGRSALKTGVLAGIGIASGILVAAGANELVVLFAAGFIGSMFALSKRDKAPKSVATLMGVAPTGSAVVAGGIVPLAAAKLFGLWPLFLFFLKIGSVLFGSGYVLLAFLRADLVERWHWLTESQLLDAIAVGQVTPGPVFTTATFIGYLLGGLPGAFVATAGIFLPAFVFVAISGPIVPRMRRSVVAGGFLDGVNVASLALMAVVTIQLASAALVDPITIALGLIAAVMLLRYKINSFWIILGAGLIGIIKTAL